MGFKWMVLVLGFSGPVVASDACYLFERRSDSWYKCKEDAQDSRETQARLDRWQDKIQADERASMQSAQAEYDASRIQRALQDLQRQREYGK